MIEKSLTQPGIISNEAPGVVVSIAIIILVAIVASLASQPILIRLVNRLVKSQDDMSEVQKQKRADTLVAVFGTAVHVLIWVIAVLVILSYLQVNLAALATGAGLLGIVIGFGAQSTIKDILAGIFIIAENQYRVGDIVSLYASGKDVAGVVERITIRITQLRDLDGNLHLIPNGAADVITNLSFDYANVNIDIGVDYSADIDKVEKIINETGQVLADDPEWKEHIYEAIQFLRLDAFEDSAVRVKALGKVEPAKQWQVSGEFRRRIKKAFEKEGISIPFPQVVVSQRDQK